MTAIEEAREARDEARNHVEHFALSEGDATRVTRLADVIDALIAEHERLIREMHQRELHHFETEKMLAEAGIDPDVPPSDDDREALAQALFRTLYDAGVSFQSGDLIPRLTATVRAAGFRRQGPPSDDEREALAYLITAFRFRERGIPGRIGEPDLAIARPLADFLTREGFRRQGPPSDDDRETLTERFANLIFEHGLRSPESTKAVIAFKEVTAGFRRQGPITVTTVPAMDALPARTVVMDGGGEVWRKCSNGRWDCLDSNGDAPTEEASTVLWQSMNGPSATVLWKPVEAAERARSAAPSTTEQEGAHDRDRDGICRRCGHGLNAAMILDGEKPCAVPSPTEQEKP